MLFHLTGNLNLNEFLLLFHEQIYIYDLDGQLIDNPGMLIYRMFHKIMIVFPKKNPNYNSQIAAEINLILLEYVNDT